MRRIDNDRLAKLLTEGFEGQVIFEGRVIIWKPSPDRDDVGETYYSAQGRFTLEATSRKQGEYCLSNGSGARDGYSQVIFTIKHWNIARSNSDDDLNTRRIVSVPVTFAGSDNSLQITPDMNGQILY